MRFTKMHGAGNDYVYIDGWDHYVSDPPALARRIADRHFGVGGDGLVLILPDDCADARMRMFNPDGSESEMCGNAIRCVAKYVHDHGRCSSNPLRIATLAGVMTIDLVLDAQGKVSRATVDMGEPILAGPAIPTAFHDDRVVDRPIEVARRTWNVTCVSMGNPHAVVYLDDIASEDLTQLGPAFENHQAFPRRVNLHVVQVLGPGEVTMATWERGTGPTLACGTGAAAVCVAGVLTGRTERQLLAHLPGGDLQLRWDEASNRVYKTGPAVEVFSGEWPE